MLGLDLLDGLGCGLCEEVLVAELLVELGEVFLRLCLALFEALFLLVEVDEPGEQRVDLDLVDEVDA